MSSAIVPNRRDNAAIMEFDISINQKNILEKDQLNTCLISLVLREDEMS